MSAPVARRGGFSGRTWSARHVAILLQFARIGVIRKSQFRVEFLNQVVMDCAFYLAHVLFFEYLFDHTESIAGWSRGEVRVFLGFNFLSDAFGMIWLGQAWHLAADVKQGNLDPVRVRPASPVVLYFFQRFSLEGVVNALIALGYLGWAARGHGVAPTLANLALAAWAIALCCWARVVLAVLYGIVEFHLVDSDLSRFAHVVFSEVNDKPLDVFGRRVRWLFVSLVPLGALSWLPAAMLLGRIAPATALAHSAWIVVLGLGFCRAWRASFRRYESALG